MDLFNLFFFLGLTEIPVDQSASRCETRPPDKNEMSSIEENWSLEETPRITSPGSPTSKRLANKLSALKFCNLLFVYVF